MGASINAVHHVLFVAVMSVACLVGPSYTTACYALLLLLHMFFHEVQVVSITGHTTVMPYPSVNIAALIVSSVHCICMTASSITYATDRDDFEDWYTNHTTVLEGFGFYLYEEPLGTLDRFLRHLIPSVLLVATCIARIATATPCSASISSTALFTTSIPSEPLIRRRASSSIGSLVLPTITVLSGTVAVLWPRVITIPYLLIFLTSTSAWGLRASRRKLPTKALRLIYLIMWLATTASIIMHFVAQQEFFESTYNDNKSTFGWVGILRLSSFTAIFDTAKGREYVGHILVLPIICYIAWRAYFNLAKDAAKHLLEATYLAAYGEEEEEEEEEEVEDDEQNLEGADAERTNENASSPLLNPPEVEDTGSTTYLPMVKIPTDPPGEPQPDPHLSPETTFSDITHEHTQVSEATGVGKPRGKLLTSVRYFMSKYSPHALGVVLGLTALVDPSYLSAIWLVLLFVFMWCVLILEKVGFIIKILPFALVWSTLHVTAIYVASIPSVLDYGNTTMDKLDSIGVTRNDGSDTLALAAHASLIVLIAVVIRASSLTSDKPREDNPPEMQDRQAVTLLKRIQEQLLSRAQYVSLLITVIVGCLHVDLLQSGLLVFFVVFASSPSTAKKYWGLLLAYQIALTLFLYLYNVTDDGFHIPDKVGNLDWSTLVEGPMSTMWELTPFLVMVFFSTWQLRLYRKTSNSEPEPLNPRIILFGANTSLLMTWVVMILVFMFAAPSLMTAGYLLLFLWVSAVTAFGGGARSASLAMTWVVALCYSTACFLSSYLFQFDGLASYFAEAVNAVLDCEGSDNTTTPCVRQFGFKSYGSVETRVVNLFPHWVIAALVIMQASYLRQAWSLPHDTLEDDGTDPGPYFTKINRAVRRTKDALTVLAPVAIYFALWVASSDSHSLNACGYFIMLISTMVTGTVNSLMLVLYSSCVILLKFWYQYKFFPTFMSRTSYRYFGLEKVGTIWSCQKAYDDEELCRFISGCTWSEQQSYCIPPPHDASLSSKIWIDVLVLVTAMICRRVRLWAFHDAPEGMSTDAYLKSMTLFDHSEKDSKPDTPGSPAAASSAASPIASTQVTVDVPEEFEDYTPEEIQLIVRIQAAWRTYLVQKRLSNAKLVEAIEGSTLSIAGHSIETVLSAIYTGEQGFVDVSNLIKKRVESGGLLVTVSDPELGVTASLGNSKVLRVSYLPMVNKEKSAVTTAFEGATSKIKELVEEASPYVRKFSSWLIGHIKWAADFGFLRWSYELTMFVLLATCAARPRIVESLVYFCVLVVMRKKERQGGLWISICIVWVMSMYFIQQFFFIGMPSGTEWGPFYKDKARIGNTWMEYWRYFGAFPDRWDLFAAFLCSLFIMLHFRYNKRYEPSNKNYAIYQCDTLTDFLSQRVEGGVSRRHKLLAVRESTEFTMERLESLLPTPEGNDFVKKPHDVPSRLHGYWLKYLPYVCLTLVFIDATAAEFITVIRMGKLALAMYLFRAWEVMEWRGNALWKHINDYFLFALVVHLIWNIPWLADRWEHSNVIKKLYSFIGIIECHDNGSDAACSGELIQVNAFEVFIMALLYLQRLNYDKFEHVFVIHKSHSNDLKAQDVKKLIEQRVQERKEEGLMKTRALVEERHRILERTKQELHGRKGNRRSQVFPPPRMIDDPELKPRDRRARKRQREAALLGFMSGKRGAFPETLVADDDENDVVRQLRRAFELGQGANVDVPGEHLSCAEQFVKGLLEGPHGVDELKGDTPEELAFRAGKVTAASNVPQETSLVAVMCMAAAAGAAAADKKKRTTTFMKVVKYFHAKTLLGRRDLTPDLIERKPWSLLFDGLFLYLKENSDLVCFVIFAINFSISVSLLDMFPVGSVFIYALLIVPRPPARYWEVMLVFMQCLLSLKCVIQALEVTFDGDMPTAIAVLYGQLGRSSFFTNVLGDFIAIVAIIARQGVLRSCGIYRSKEKLDKERSKKRHSVSSVKSSSTSRVSKVKEALRTKGDEPPLRLKAPDTFGAKVKHYILRIKAVYMKALDPLEKAGTDKDYYIKSFVIDILSFIMFIAIYQELGSESNFDLSDAIAQNLLPGALVLGMIVLMVSMVLERVVYLLGDLKAKFAMQLVLTVGYLFGFFIWFQDYNTSSESGHVAAAFFFMLRALWLYISAKQIERGYPVVRRHDCFTDTSDFKVYLAYQICRAIPFLWEMRVLLDWCCSKTTLKLNYWLKLEDVRNEMLVRKMDIEDSKETNPKPGMSFPTKKKLTSGWLLIVAMLVLIFFPLLYYSTFSPALQTNSVQQMYIGVAFDGSPPFYQNDYLVPGDAKKDGTLAKDLARTRGSVASQSVTISTKNLQLLEFTAFSSQRWQITDPAAAVLAGKFLNASSNPAAVPNLVTSIEAVRTTGAAADLDQKTIQRYRVDTGNQTMMDGIVELLLWNGTGEEPPPVHFPDLLSPFLLNKPTTLNFMSHDTDCYLSVMRTSGTNPDAASKYYDLRCRGLFACGNSPGEELTGCLEGKSKCPNYDHDPLPACPTGDGLVPLYYVAISDMAQNDDSPLAGLFNIGIIALYVTFVLAVGRVIRGIISGSAAAVVIQDMEDPTFISRMADHVHLARGDGNLKLEEELYYHLINLLRSPEKVLSITGLRCPPMP